MRTAPFSNRDVAVVICAHALDRWDDLLGSIRSARDQQSPVGEIIVVIDHNRQLRDRLVAMIDDGVTVRANTHAPGLSGARNTGIAASSRPLICFLDDDAQLASDCVSRLRSHFANPGVLGVGGQIVPAFDAAAPAWFPGEFLWVVGCTHDGTLPGEVRNLTGAAMCIARHAFTRAGGFSERLGRTQAGLPYGNEETEFCIRAAAAMPAGRFLYDHDALTYHRVRAERMTWRYFVRRCYAEGLSKARLKKLTRDERLSSERHYTLRILPLAMARALRKALVDLDGRALLRAMAIALGFLATVAGFAIGMLGALERPSALPSLPQDIRK